MPMSRLCLAPQSDLAIQHGGLSTLDNLDGLLQHLLEFTSSVYLSRMQLSASSSLGDTRKVGHWVKGDVDLFVGNLGSFAVGMDEEERLSGCVPA